MERTGLLNVQNVSRIKHLALGSILSVTAFEIAINSITRYIPSLVKSVLFGAI